MAFANKIGSLLKQAVSSKPSLYQAIRCMSSSKLFVGGLSYTTDDHNLREAFSGYGEVVEARVILDRETGRSRGFGFITFTSGEEASAALTAMDGKDLHGRMVRVNYATDRRAGFGGGGGYGGGGYGGGGGSYGGGGGGGYAGGGYSGGYGNSGGGYGNSGGGYGGGQAYGGDGAGYGGDGYGSGAAGYGSGDASGGYSGGRGGAADDGSGNVPGGQNYTGGNSSFGVGSDQQNFKLYNQSGSNTNSGNQNELDVGLKDVFDESDDFANKRGQP